VLRPAAAAGQFELLRREPTGELGEYVEFHWIVRWDLRGHAAHTQQVLTHPNVHLVFEEPGPFAHGIRREVFERRLTGADQVFGVKFRPGAFRPLLGSPVLDLIDRRVPAEELFGPSAAQAQRAVLGAADPAAMQQAAEDFLRGVLPDRPDPMAAQVGAIVDRITAAPTLFRVDELAADCGLSVRSLQRLFAEYVGASPKWVLRRARLHEAAARAEEEAGIDWAALAADLGYCDQAHLTRDFTAAVGAPPAKYARA
jgi:AraC-like DNA-binding protein